MNTTFNTMNTMVEIFNALASVKGHQFVGVVTETSVRMNKTGNPYFGRVTKVTTSRVSFNYSYENACNNRAEKEGYDRNFVTESLPWGQWIDGQTNRLISHKGGVFVRFYKIPTELPKVTYYLDGVEVTDNSVLNEIFSYIPQRSDYSKKQAEAGIVDIEKQCKPYAVALENILRITIGGVTYSK